ncbi:hypothetical protein [Flavobacterium polysaccharolyticum]|uniref:NTF2 fold immunity protein n=1 Tax=Flavobacterium polysaccharolyticum TaxID=3133148 RepID=A0ABU9NJS0_9FLAO
MGLFNQFFGKKSNDSNQKMLKVSINDLNISISETHEKFIPLKDEIVAFLVDKLQDINFLEREIFERSQKLKNPKDPNQVQPGETELWDEYAARYKELLTPIALNPSAGGSYSFGNPAKYDYLSNPDTEIFFIMKSSNRAVVETRYKYGIGVVQKHQFVLKKETENWKIASKKYGFSDETTWYKGDI